MRHRNPFRATASIESSRMRLVVLAEVSVRSALAPALFRSRLLLAGIALFAGSAGADERPTAGQIERFERQIRPVLVEKCLECHGPKKQESGLRLDSRAAMLRGSDSGPVVVPGRPGESRLIEALKQTGELKMPPDEPLPAGLVEHFVKWIEQGAVWPESTSPNPASPAASIADAAARHWAFQPLRVAPVPTQLAPADAAAVRDPLDRRVAAVRASSGLAAAPPADRRTLVRRLSFDLRGLPPAPEEIAEFLADDGPDAVERLVDRWLASPSYGERNARQWLDVARYADNKGYVFFEEKTFPWAFAYRDYVVEAFNADLPYDRFVIEQLAADQTPAAAEDRRVLRALGFLTVGGRFMGNTHDVVDDRIDVVTRGLMGLTVVCSRCHDHKYDPVPQTDYYSLYGVFRSCEEPTVPPLFAELPATDEAKKFTADLEVRVGKLNEFVQRKHRELVVGARTRVAEYLLAARQAQRQPATDDFMLIADTNDLNPAMIVRWRVFLEKTARQPHPVWSVWHRLAALEDAAFATGAAELSRELAAPAAGAGGAPPGVELHPRVRERFAAKPPTTLAEAAQVYGELLTDVERRWQELLAEATKAGRPAPDAMPDPADELLRRTLYGPDAPPDVPVALGWGFLTLLPDRPSQGEYQRLLKEVEAWMMAGPGAPPRAMVLVDLPQPYEPRVFLRGNPNRLGDFVPRQAPVVVNPARRPFSQGAGRLELAREIVSPANPLTARVMVNRVWGQLIGAPLVATPSDFGLRSEPPTHPELLDELAARFIADGWSIKRLQRAIVTSATYGQSSEATSETLAADPENRRLGRMHRRRLEFEALRDSLLVVADSLDRRLGGPAVQLLGDAVVPRRTLYGFIDRLDVSSLLTTFDFPNPSATSPRRDATITPPQALYLMNGPLAAEIAARFAGRADVTGEAPEARRAARMVEIAWGREPTADELEWMAEYVRSQPPADAWRRLAQALLMANEFLYLD